MWQRQNQPLPRFYVIPIGQLIDNTVCRWERPPILEPEHWWHKTPQKRRNIYRRLPLVHLGADNLISEHAIVRAHYRCQPLLIKMFASSNYGKRTFNATDTKVITQFRLLKFYSVAFNAEN